MSRIHGCSDIENAKIGFAVAVVKDVCAKNSNDCKHCPFYEYSECGFKKYDPKDIIVSTSVYFE